MAVILASAVLAAFGVGLVTFGIVDKAKARLRPIEESPPVTWWEQAVHHQVWIHTIDAGEGRTIRGFVKTVAVDGVLLAGAEYLDDNGAVIPLGGEAFIPRERVNWVQVPHRQS